VKDTIFKGWGTEKYSGCEGSQAMPARSSDKGTFALKTKSELLQDWRFTANQFVSSKYKYIKIQFLPHRNHIMAPLQSPTG
jgi:hypothetical protein